MAASTRKALASCALGAIHDDDDGDDRKRIQKGYLPLVLIRDDDIDQAGVSESETRVLVRVRDLREPCMAALLEMAKQRFGYDQQGALRVPCDAQHFHHVVTMARKSKAATKRRHS